MTQAVSEEIIQAEDAQSDVASASTEKKGRETYRRLLRAVKPYWLIFLLGVIGTIALSCIDAGFMWLIKPIVNKGLIQRQLSFVQWLPVVIVLIFLLRGIAGFFSNYFTYRVARNVVMDFRRLLFRKLMCLPANFYDRHNSSRLLSTIVYNVEQVALASSDALLTTLRETALTIGLLIVMFSMSWQLSLMLLVVVPPIAWVVKWSSKRLRRVSSEVQKAMGDVTHVADEGIQAYRVVRIFGAQSYENKKFDKATNDNRQRELKIVVTSSITTASIQLLIAVPMALALYYATMPSSPVSPGAFGAILASLISLLRPMRRLTTVNAEIQKGVAGAESIFTILDQPAEKDHGTRRVDRVKGAIEFKQVNFRYDQSSDQVLQDINFTVEPGQTVAIVGKSGSGKSTLVSLLPRFYDVKEGLLSIDGVDVNEYRLQDLRRQFAFVTQDTVLFDDTIANNIAYGMSDKVDLEQIKKMAIAANAHDFIEELPEGYHTLVGENGVLLSGGQRQRIAIARSLLAHSPILILDEATSALDTHSERHIQAALNHLIRQQTTLVIAHRLSTIENADLILVMEKSRIVEKGTHAELIRHNGVYAKLHEMQFQQKEVPAVTNI